LERPVAILGFGVQWRSWLLSPLRSAVRRHTTGLPRAPSAPMWLARRLGGCLIANPEAWRRQVQKRGNVMLVAHLSPSCDRGPDGNVTYLIGGWPGEGSSSRVHTRLGSYFQTAERGPSDKATNTPKGLSSIFSWEWSICLSETWSCGKRHF